MRDNHFHWRLTGWVIGALLLFLGGGCISSPSYHVGVLLGHFKARPFPLIRYWAEFSEEEFRGDLVNVPIVGVPGTIPVGYMADAITDVVCFPIDWPLSWFASNPKVELVPVENGQYEVQISDICNTELHWDITQCAGAVPVTIQVKQGTLRIQLVDGSKLPIEISVGQSDGVFNYRDGTRRHPNTTNGRWTLFCCPPTNGLLPWLVVHLLLCNDLTGKQRSYFPDSRVSLFPSSQRRDESAFANIPFDVSYRVLFIPSVDFLGEVTYQGKPIRSVTLSAPTRRWFW